jgi:hypothetical protein
MYQGRESSLRSCSLRPIGYAPFDQAQGRQDRRRFVPQNHMVWTILGCQSVHSPGK